ncbi:MAG TPA: hypothetical protein VLQ48_15530 [Chloroflexia bacterium]|nr:hypothetical protein [Chloroflexia bacterium]
MADSPFDGAGRRMCANLPLKIAISYWASHLASWLVWLFGVTRSKCWKPSKIGWYTA